MNVPYYLSHPPLKKRRRTATTVLAGDFEPRPARDVLTSLLNGVPPYKAVEKDEEARMLKRREKKERRRAKLAARRELSTAGPGPASVANAHALAAAAPGPSSGSGAGASASARRSSSPPRPPAVNHSTSAFWRARGPVVPATRSVSLSPAPDGFSPPPTPGPSISSSTSYTSSKRPHTPDDGFSFAERSVTPPAQSDGQRHRKRVAARKGWKGWVEGSPPPSTKLINLDSAPVLRERRTRSGKNFDAICVGQDSWI